MVKLLSAESELSSGLAFVPWITLGFPSGGSFLCSIKSLCEAGGL